MPEPTTSELAQAIQEVSERASLLVREEIELAKAEMTEKVTKLAQGRGGRDRGRHLRRLRADLPAPLPVLGLFALVSDDINFVWVGYLIAGGLLLLLGGLAGFLATRFVKGGAPPTPVMAIEEAQLIKQTIETSRPPSRSAPAAASRPPTPPTAQH